MDETDISVLRFGKKKDKEKDKEPADNQEYDEVDGMAVEEIKGPIRSIATRDVNYNTNNENIGIALIFNHKEIRNQEPRKGTERDRDRVKSMLKQYGFDVRTFDDLTFEKLNGQLKDVAREDHSKNDCLVVVVMSHGVEGKVYAKDMTYPVERLWTPFLGENCKSLINKPKLFFIQACRGNQLERPVTYETERVTPMSRFASAPDESQKITYAIPNTADLLVFYSTFEGYYSFRNVENGSWFIQALCQTFEEALKNNDERGTELFQLLTTINRKVAYEYQSMTRQEATNEMKEMPNFLSTLTKMFYLRVKRK
ncbi:caspase-1 [Episyrphus balteatus]|uniref:caspase-1 n=1 Tax=Episyrphus balteatus TaxID=286459 RepID=UPI0024868EDC|nr:caspase-1 [Episyrphus balteatus]